MNEIYLTGKLVAVYVPEAPASQPKHLVYQLRVAHVNAQKQVRYENYTVNAWRNLATWAEANLRVGMEVFVRGHLSQRMTNAGLLTEVTALRIAPLAVSRTVQAVAATAFANAAEEPVVKPAAENVPAANAEENAAEASAPETL